MKACNCRNQVAFFNDYLICEVIFNRLFCNSWFYCFNFLINFSISSTGSLSLIILSFSRYSIPFFLSTISCFTNCITTHKLPCTLTPCSVASLRNLASPVSKGHPNCFAFHKTVLSISVLKTLLVLNCITSSIYSALISNTVNFFKRIKCSICLRCSDSRISF